MVWCHFKDSVAQGSDSFCSTQAFSLLDEVHPDYGRQSGLPKVQPFKSYSHPNATLHPQADTSNELPHSLKPPPSQLSLPYC